MSSHTTPNAPSTTVGVIVHRTIADILLVSRSPSADQAKKVITARTQSIGDRSHTRAVRQRVLGLVSLYFWHLALDKSWDFVGAEVALGRGAMDLIFRQKRLVLIDEVKSGVDARLSLGRSTQDQTDRYVHEARAVYGADLIGVRVLSLADPGRSLLKTAPGAHQILLDTPYHPWSKN